MVSELVMRARQIDFGHVALGAIVLSHLAHLGAGFAACRMARRAPRIVGASRAFERLVWIVAGDTADARVGGIVAPAVGQAVGLESEVVQIVRPVGRNLRPSAVALAAKIGELLGRQ